MTITAHPNNNCRCCAAPTDFVILLCSCSEFNTTLISDTFTDTDDTLVTAHTPDVDNVGGGWSTYAGTVVPTIQSNKLSFSDASVDNAFILIDSGVPNGDVSVDFSGDIEDVDAVVNLLFRVPLISSTQSEWRLSVNRNQVSLFKRVGGTFTLVDTSTPVGNGTHTLRAVFCCDDITCYVDGTEVFSVSDPTHRDNTGIALNSRAGSGKTMLNDNLLFKGE